jgi:hypothetical protein
MVSAPACAGAEGSDTGLSMHSISPANRLVWVALLTVVVCLAVAFPADLGRGQTQLDPAAKARRLDELFGKLKSAQDEDEGDAAVAEIWKLWQRSGTPELDEKMEQAAALMGQGVLQLALPTFSHLVERAPDWAEAWNKRATALYLIGQHDLSLADIDRGWPWSPGISGRWPAWASSISPGANTARRSPSTRS